MVASRPTASPDSSNSPVVLVAPQQRDAATENARLRAQLAEQVARSEAAERVLQHMRTLTGAQQVEIAELREGRHKTAQLERALAEARADAAARERALTRSAPHAAAGDDEVAALYAEMEAMAEASSSAMEAACAEIERLEGELERVTEAGDAAAQQHATEREALKRTLDAARAAHADEADSLRARLALARDGVTEPAEGRADLAGHQAAVDTMIRSIRAALAAEDPEWLAQLARHLGARLRALGVVRMSTVAAHLERAAQAGDLESAVPLVARLQTEPLA